MVESITNMFNTFFVGIYEFLPNSPFRYYLENSSQIPFLGVLNWFIPVAEIVAVMQVWATVCILYFSYSAVMRMIRIIK